MGSEDRGESPVHRRCIGDEARCGAQFPPRRRRRCTTDVASASAMHRRRIGDAARSSDTSYLDPYLGGL
eukprot:6972325-Pyramimonas_sp.AAC.1